VSNTIFTTTTSATTKPRLDATICIEAFKPASVEKAGYLSVELLEFHPDFAPRLKFRGYAYVKAQPELLRPEHAHIYCICGESYLNEPYISISEVFIHETDLQEMMRYCRKQAQPIIIHPCSLPFPMFSRGQRVVTVEYKRKNRDLTPSPGQLGTVTENSSYAGKTSVRFDDLEWNKGQNGCVSPAISVPSLALRAVKTTDNQCRSDG